MSNQVQQRNDVKKFVAKRNNSKAKANKGNHVKKIIALSSLLIWYLVIGVSTALRPGLGRATKKPVKKVARKLRQHTLNPSSKIDQLSVPEELWNEALPSVTPWKKTRSPMNIVLPPSDWPWNTDESHITGGWTLSPCSATVSFSSSGKGVIINQRAGNAAHSHFLNMGNERRSVHRYHHHSG